MAQVWSLRTRVEYQEEEELDYTEMAQGTPAEEQLAQSLVAGPRSAVQCPRRHTCGTQ